MELNRLYHNYINLKFDRKLPLLRTEHFEYAFCEDGSAELFRAGSQDVHFIGWNNELLPPDPNYTDSKGLVPVLAARFGELDVYEEQILDYLLFTVNATTSIDAYNTYSQMNDQMKQYCFFQLAQLPNIYVLTAEQKISLRDYFFWFYLYAHPVNEDTLEAFSFHGADLIHTKTGIPVRDYFEAYHTHYIHNHAMYKKCLSLSPQELEACLKLTLQLLDAVEGRLTGLTLPSGDGLEPALQMINRVDDLLDAYTRDKSYVFGVMRDLLTYAPSTPYREHVIRTLLNNFVCYILFFDFDQINELTEFFRGDPAIGKLVVSRMFTETIFLQKILRQSRIDLRNYPAVTALFDENARQMYG
jgi:hypothetical protein